MATNLKAAESGYAYLTKENIEVYDCCVCGMLFGLSAAFVRRRREDHDWWYCPSGHVQHFTGKSDEEKAVERAEAAERRAAQAEQAARTQRERREATERSLRTTKGHLTRMRNRIAAGVCPVPGCRRSGFSKVRQHIAAKHPTWLAEHVHELDDPGQ